MAIPSPVLCAIELLQIGIHAPLKALRSFAEAPQVDY